ncbi:MAG: DUF429 domain-containing protein [Candidatus Baldrarchaeia archaeon]
MKCQRIRVVGVDLAGSERRETGWALLDGRTLTVKKLFSDDEIIRETLDAHPLVVAIDAPLSLPTSGKMRRADREMHRFGLPVLPPLFPHMRMLTYRGIRIARILRSHGLKVIEVHPTSTRKILGLPPRKDPMVIQDAITKLGYNGDVRRKSLSMHEVDAILAAITAELYIRGLTTEVGDPMEGVIIIPRRSDERIE